MPCYEEGTWQQLPMAPDPGLQCDSNRAASQSHDNGDLGSIVLLSFAAWLILKRFI
jgi:hypothetical protein